MANFTDGFFVVTNQSFAGGKPPANHAHAPQKPGSVVLTAYRRGVKWPIVLCDKCSIDYKAAGYESCEFPDGFVMSDSCLICDAPGHADYLLYEWHDRICPIDADGQGSWRPTPRTVAIRPDSVAWQLARYHSMLMVPVAVEGV